MPAIQLDPAGVPFGTLAPTLARFLSWLHSFPLTEAESLGVPVQDVGSFLEEVRAEALSDFEFVKKVALEAPLEESYAYLKAGPRRRWRGRP